MTIFEFIIPQSKAEAVSDAVALGAVSSPLWLHEISGMGRDLLPWFGIAWLITQIAVKLHTTYWKKK